MGSDSKESKGFTGLVDLVSDLSDLKPLDDIESQKAAKVPAEKRETRPVSNSGKGQNSTTTSSKKPEDKPSDNASNAAFPEPPADKGMDKQFLIWATVAIFAVAILYLSSQSSQRTPTATSSPDSYSTQADNNSGTSQSGNSVEGEPDYSDLSFEDLNGESTQTNQAPATSPEPTRYDDVAFPYRKPPVGSNEVLPISQIRWCVRESIQIETMRDRGKFSTNDGVDEFNEIVDDYNRRCASYRYREGNLSLAQRQVEEQRTSIEADALVKAYADEPAASTGAATNDAPKKPNAQYTRQAQQLLTDLGYDPGPVDGVYGRRTAAAVKAFQRAQGKAVDGWFSERLLHMLRSAILKNPEKHKEPSGSQRGIPGNNEGFDKSKDISFISEADQAGIIDACKYKGSPADVYSCQEKELNKLKQTGPAPNLSGLTSFE
ncbi:peptidoglycan-binding domain-containing protein, partial [Marinobacter gelidimuriae]|uniref:peptidoglycan-binding domain-containing protein n=1 Tax=Marinobacter gelidimuriae TaxID=2739064 RepID=UPI001E5890D0